MTVSTVGGKQGTYLLFYHCFVSHIHKLVGALMKVFRLMLELNDPLYIRGKARDMPVILPLFCFADTSKQACGSTKEGLPVCAGVK